MIKWLQRFWPPVLVFILTLLSWEIFVRICMIEAWILPTPLVIIQEMSQSLQGLLDHMISTIRIALLGLLIGVCVGVCIASLFHLIPFLKRSIYPFILLSQNIPMIALAPLLVVWFGFGDFPKLLVVAMVCFFPVTIATLGGFAQTDQSLQIYMKMSGATRWQRFVKLEWPSAVPSFFSGLKLSATYSVMGAVIAEWLGAEKGLGKVMTLASKSFATERVFVVITLIVFLSLLLFALINWVEKFIVKGNRSDER